MEVAFVLSLFAFGRYISTKVDQTGIFQKERRIEANVYF
jgi:hypothetical protein